MVFNQNPIFMVFYKFFLALALGALIGLEREKKHREEKHSMDFAGIRTFMLITFLGALSSYLAHAYYEWIIAVSLVCFIITITTAYVLSSIFNKDIGMTTELSAIIAFIIGILVFTTSQEIPVLVAIVTTLVLSLKSPLHQFAYTVKSQELFDTIKFVVITFVILPILKPLGSFGPFDSINLYEIWLMVVFVSAFSYGAYLLVGAFGTKSGTLLTGLLGGIFSSTATITTLANKSKDHDNVNNLVAAAALASATMFLRLLIEVSILNFSMVEKLAFPMVLLALVGFISVSFFWKRNNHVEPDISYSSPLQIKTALQFGLFYGFILFLSNVLYHYFGSKGIFIAALVSGIADADAISIFVARNNNTAMGVGIAAIVLASLVNTIVKLIIAKAFGKREFGNMLIKIFIPVISVGVILLFVL